MSRILVFGNMNIETSVAVGGFPLPYEPVYYAPQGINSIVSGVGFNVAKALATLGNEVRLVSIVGQDNAGILAKNIAENAGISPDYILPLALETPQSVVLYAPDGQRTIFVDIKQTGEQTYPPDTFAQALAGCDLAVMTNINYTRPFLEVVRNAGIPIATDIQTIGNIDDEYNRDYMENAGILFQSDERLPCSPADWAKQIFDQYDTQIVVVGMGDKGAWLAVRPDNFSDHFPAQTIRPVVNTAGAGDALFACFNHIFAHTQNPYLALKKATIFASYKIGESGATNGFLNSRNLNKLFHNYR
jgi:ribokinase